MNEQRPSNRLSLELRMDAILFSNSLIQPKKKHTNKSHTTQIPYATDLSISNVVF